MGDIQPITVGQAMKDVPFREMILSVASGIAEAQYKLDKTSIRITQMMSGVDPKDRVPLGLRGKTYSLLELGFTPSFYQFAETTLEIKMSVTITRSQDSEGNARYHAFCMMVNASNSNKYSYSATGSSVMKTKLVPIPPPAILEERIRHMLREEGIGVSETT
ncbi:MAG: hypothetical protein GY859_19725 [Desulfobacterales bacterium]|nr:hypothetical protein [Desulfobacterales bacterium]